MGGKAGHSHGGREEVEEGEKGLTEGGLGWRGAAEGLGEGKLFERGMKGAEGGRETGEGSS